MVYFDRPSRKWIGDHFLGDNKGRDERITKHYIKRTP